MKVRSKILTVGILKKILVEIPDDTLVFTLMDSGDFTTDIELRIVDDDLHISAWKEVTKRRLK